jgi:hypothetical protein
VLVAEICAAEVTELPSAALGACAQTCPVQPERLEKLGMLPYTGGQRDADGSRGSRLDSPLPLGFRLRESQVASPFAP